ncbi:hypothetical protein SLE2022_133020 [Rubroshorea leprosula]
MNSNFKINGGTEYKDKWSVEDSDDDADQCSCDFNSEQTQRDKEDDDMVTELCVLETDIEDEAKGSDAMAHLSVDTSVVKLLSLQNKQERKKYVQLKG